MAGFNPQDYETVDSRLHRFWDDILAAKLTATIETDLIEVARDPQGKPLQYVVKTTIVISDGRRGTGLAEELVGSSPVNRTSALENAETSSTGRALAQLGYSPKGSRASAEEMDKVARAESQAKHPTTAPKAPKATPLRVVEAEKDLKGNVVSITTTDAPLDPKDNGNKATPEQWGHLVRKFGSKNAVVKQARAIYEDAVGSALDITFLQAEALLEGVK